MNIRTIIVLITMSLFSIASQAQIIWEIELTKSENQKETLDKANDQIFTFDLSKDEIILSVKTDIDEQTHTEGLTIEIENFKNGRFIQGYKQESKKHINQRLNLNSITANIYSDIQREGNKFRIISAYFIDGQKHEDQLMVFELK
ncbi:MAG: hypothetical protein JEZ03_05780 [Bacteroidales bacterium]|nr:hypothetical protein [Bacteroidales bacterium]